MIRISLDNLTFLELRDNTDEQWKRLWPVLDLFYVFLKEKGYSSDAISLKINTIAAFLIDFLYKQTLIRSIADVNREYIDEFMLEWHDTHFSEATPQERAEVTGALKEFFEFLQAENIVSGQQQDEIEKALQ